MSRFYAEIEGSRGPATRQGTPASGMRSHTRGWSVGAEVWCHVGPDGRDVVEVYATAGSNGGSRPVLLARLEETEGGRRVVELNRDAEGAV